MTIRETVVDDIKQFQRVRNSDTENMLPDPNLSTVYILFTGASFVV